jgi:integrase
LILTGARFREILDAQWEHVDFERGIIHLQNSKTGAKPIYISAAALEVLNTLPRIKGNPHVIPGEKKVAAPTSRSRGEPSRAPLDWKASASTTFATASLLSALARPWGFRSSESCLGTARPRPRTVTRTWTPIRCAARSKTSARRSMLP